jgi:glycosyltransferase involved in cell wall biosynthesis
VAHGGLPHELIPAEMVGRVHVSDAEDAHRRGAYGRRRSGDVFDGRLARRRVSARDITVVVPSHSRRLRLRWLLNALEEQTLEPRKWEVVVVHDYPAQEARALVDEHPLAAAGVLRSVVIEPGTGSPARQRNLGWRSARTPLVAFTDDDCRPDERWLERLLDAAGRHPNAIVQGATRPDPFEVAVFAGPHVRTIHVDPPGPFGQTCNILYPRDVLERVGGFDERVPAAAGEDTDLALRARASGTSMVGAPEALVYHAIEARDLAGAVRLARKWEHVAFVVREHPEIRRAFGSRVFWRPTHRRLALALAGLIAARRFPPAMGLVLPYVWASLNRRGPSMRRRLVCAVEFPGELVVDIAEMGALVRGSVRYRTLVL